MRAQFEIDETQALAVRKYARQAGLKRAQAMRLALAVGTDVLSAVRNAETAATDPEQFLTPQVKEETNVS